MANFGDIISSLNLGASESVRRNSANDAFEAFTPSSTLGPSEFTGFRVLLSEPGVAITNTFQGGGSHERQFFEYEIYDITGNYNSTVRRFTAPLTGYYHFDVGLSVNDLEEAADIWINIVKNASFSSNVLQGSISSVTIADDRFANPHGFAAKAAVSCSCDTFLEEEDTIDIVGYTSSIGDLDYTDGQNWFTGHLIGV